MTPVDRAVAFIRKQGSARTPDLAKLLAMDDAEVEKLLATPAGQGVLVTCGVQVGEAKLTEYRMSALQGGDVVFSPRQVGRRAAAPPDPVKERLREWRPSRSTSQASARVATSSPLPAAAPALVVHPKENDMTIREKIEKVLNENGPMDSRAMRKHGLKDATLSQHLGDLADRKLLVRLGGGPRSTIYGVPGQKLGETTSRQRVALASGGELGKRTKSDSPYAAVLKDLDARRSVKVAELAKLDAAIEAVRLLA